MLLLVFLMVLGSLSVCLVGHGHGQHTSLCVLSNTKGRRQLVRIFFSKYLAIFFSVVTA